MQPNLSNCLYDTVIDYIILGLKLERVVHPLQAAWQTRSEFRKEEER